MATIDIKVSQNALNYAPNNDFGVMVDGVEAVVYTAAANYLAPLSARMSGTSLVSTFSDGAIETYSGFVKDSPGAASGTATATAYQLELKGSASVWYSGKLNVDYTTGTAGLDASPSTKGMVINDVGYATEALPTDPLYNADEGNVSVHLKGTLVVAPDDTVSGTINQFAVTAEKNMTGVTVDGNFHVSANLLTDGEGQTHSTVSGTLTGYHLAYADGSHFDVTGLSANLGSPAMADVTLISHPEYFAGNDTINIDMPSIDFFYLMAAGAGDDQITVKGGGGNLGVDAGDGNDRITVLGDSHVIDGGAGVDTIVLPGAHADYQVNHNSNAAFDTITDKLGAKDTLSGIERLQFSDTTVALDIDGNGGQAYRLYQAAFARTPDKAGVGYWIGVLDRGADLYNVAQGFVDSQEFKDAYGANPSNHDLVSKFYQNILHRAPDQAGLDYWVGLLDNHKATVAGVLEGISESAENKAGLASVIGNGFEFTPYH